MRASGRPAVPPCRPTRKSTAPATCIEAPSGSVIATKNKKHFEPLTEILGKSLAVSAHAMTTKSKSANLPP
jgi:hypothetical protein